MPRVAVFVSQIIVYMLLASTTLQAGDPAHHKHKKCTTLKIEDQYQSTEGLQQGLAGAGIVESNLIYAIDFTNSNRKRGKLTYVVSSMTEEDKKIFMNLHWTDPRWPNPYRQAINITSNVLKYFDKDQKYPVYGFGDSKTKGHSVFPVTLGDEYCIGVEQIEQAYAKVLPNIEMAGPTSFAPAINKAMDIVYANNGAYHILVIITDGSLTEGFETLNLNTLAKASLFPLSIIIVGVGDGETNGGFDGMNLLDDGVENRLFDNVQFVKLSKIMADNPTDALALQLKFAVAALMEVPTQYDIMKTMGMFRAGYVDKVLARVIKKDVSKESDLKKINKKIRTLKHKPFN